MRNKVKVVLDLSTKNVGVAIIGDGKIRHTGHVRVPAFRNVKKDVYLYSKTENKDCVKLSLQDKAHYIYLDIAGALENYEVEKIYIERVFSRVNNNTALDITLLAGMVAGRFPFTPINYDIKANQWQKKLLGVPYFSKKEITKAASLRWAQANISEDITSIDAADAVCMAQYIINEGL